MNDEFDKRFWESHWTHGANTTPILPVHPALERELATLTPGTALDAGSGQGAEAIWLSARGWNVTGADISANALNQAAENAVAAGTQVNWIEADLSVWQPDQRFDLVTTFYAHPTIPQLEFYDRIAQWVRPGGSLLIVGHLHTGSGAHHHTPAHASASGAVVSERLRAQGWQIASARDEERDVEDRRGARITLADFVVRGVRGTE